MSLLELGTKYDGFFLSSHDGNKDHISGGCHGKFGKGDYDDAKIKKEAAEMGADPKNYPSTLKVRSRVRSPIGNCQDSIESELGHWQLLAIDYRC